jgi:hypothetical protein
MDTIKEFVELAKYLAKLRQEHQSLREKWHEIETSHFDPEECQHYFPDHTIEELRTRLLQKIRKYMTEVCTTMNKCSDRMDKISPPPTLYFKKRRSKPHGGPDIKPQCHHVTFRNNPTIRLCSLPELQSFIREEQKQNIIDAGVPSISPLDFPESFSPDPN